VTRSVRGTAPTCRTVYGGVAGKRNWDLLATVTPRFNPKSRISELSCRAGA